MLLLVVAQFFVQRCDVFRQLDVVDGAGDEVREELAVTAPAAFLCASKEKSML